VSVVPHAFHAEAEVPIHMSLAIFIFSVDRLDASFATVKADYGQVRSYVQNTIFSKGRSDA